jgi:hypothetical protein
MASDWRAAGAVEHRKERALRRQRRHAVGMIDGRD